MLLQLEITTKKLLLLSQKKSGTLIAQTIQLQRKSFGLVAKMQI